MKPATNAVLVNDLKELAGDLSQSHGKALRLVIQMYYELITEIAQLEDQISAVEKRLRIRRAPVGDPAKEQELFDAFDSVGGALATKTIDAVLEDLGDRTGPEVEACREVFVMHKQLRER